MTPLGSDTADRLTSLLVCFVLAAIAVYALANRLRRDAGLPAVVFFLFSPIALLWSRASLIQRPASRRHRVGSSWAALRWRDAGQTRDWIGAALLATVAMLVKITTGVLWLPFILLVSWRRSRSLASVLVMLPLAAGLGWTRWADSIKAASPATQLLTSTNLMAWNFGTPWERLDPIAWVVLLVVFLLEVGGLTFLATATPTARWAYDHRAEAIGLILAAAIGPLLFMNLYVHHTYYWVASTPAVAVLLGIGLVRSTLGRRALAGLAFAVAIVISMPTWIIAWQPAADPQGDLAIARQVRAATRPDEWVAIVGRDWDPSILYYADRRGYAVPTWQTPSLAGYHVFVVLPGSNRAIEQGGQSP